MTSACFSRGHTGFSRNATLVATVNPPALAGGVFNADLYKNNNRKNLSGVINKLSLIISGTFIDLGDKQHTVKIVNSMHSIFYTKVGYLVKFTQ